MKKPLVGAAVAFSDYLRGDLCTHVTGILGGMIWGVGMSFNVIASGSAGFCDFLRPGAGCNHGCGFLGSFHLEGVSHRAHRNYYAHHGDVWLLSCVARADHSCPYVLMNCVRMLSTGRDYSGEPTLPDSSLGHPLEEVQEPLPTW